MSNSEPAFHLVTVDVLAEPATEIFVIDHAFQRCGRGIGRLRAELPPGLYKLKYRAGSTIHEELHTIDPASGALTIRAPRLRFSSPAPLSGTLSTAPEDEHAAGELSREVHGTVGTGSQLFLFVRGRSAFPGGGRRAGTSVHDLSGRLLLSVDDVGSSGSSSRGSWTGCTVDVDPGPYRLRMRRPGWGEVEQVLVACRSWQTQVFVDQDDDVAGPDDLSVFMSRSGQGFDPDAGDSRLAELTRIALMNHRRVLDDALVRRLTTGEYEDPMLGLYGAHQLVSEGDADPAQLEVVVARLRGLLGEHPDVDALSLLSGAVQPAAVETPPMLTSSWALLVDRAIKHPGLVPEGSLTSRVAGALWGSGCWLMWLPERLEDASELDVPIGEAIGRIVAAGRQQEAAPAEAGFDPADLTDMEEAVWSQLTRRGDRPIGRGEHEATQGGGSEDSKATLRRLAESIAVPPETLSAPVAGLLGKLDARRGEGTPAGDG